LSVDAYLASSRRGSANLAPVLLRLPARVVVRASRIFIPQDSVRFVQRFHVVLSATAIRVALVRLPFVEALNLLRRGISPRAENLVVVLLGTQLGPGILEFTLTFFNQLKFTSGYC